MSIEATKVYYFRLALSGKDSADHIVRCFKLKKLENYMRYQVDFLLALKLPKNIMLFWVMAAKNS